MEGKKIEKIKQVCDVMEMFDSLHNAVSQAGGSDTTFSSQRLRVMTVTEFFAHLAPNGIRFHYERPVVDIQKHYDPLGHTNTVEELYKNKYNNNCEYISKTRDMVDSIRTAMSRISREGHKTNYDWKVDPLSLTKQENKIFEIINNLLTGQTEYERQDQEDQEA